MKPRSGGSPYRYVAVDRGAIEVPSRIPDQPCPRIGPHRRVETEEHSLVTSAIHLKHRSATTVCGTLAAQRGRAEDIARPVRNHEGVGDGACGSDVNGKGMVLFILCGRQLLKPE